MVEKRISAGTMLRQHMHHAEHLLGEVIELCTGAERELFAARRAHEGELTALTARADFACEVMEALGYRMRRHGDGSVGYEAVDE